jgi:16S rRNA (adenine1518-N6/adenine1519-N6)-dimethyltransferase
LSSHQPRKRFGQHFLHDPRVLQRMVEIIRPARDDFFVEIGPGEGALTGPLLAVLGKMDVIEIDRDLAGALSDAFGPEKLKVHEGDVLDFDFSLFPRGVRIVGNLPYNISTPLLFHLAGYAQRIRDMHFMLQREVVERMVAAASTAAYGRLSVSLQARFSIEKVLDVSRGAFRPPPKVDSAVVRMTPLEAPLVIDENLLRRAFSARRKTIRNAIPGVDLEALGFDPKLRPENLTPQDYARISACAL